MNLFLVIAIILFIGLIVLSVLVGVLSKRISKLTAGSNAQSLEKVISSNNARLQEHTLLLQEHAKDITSIQNDSRNNIQNISVVRFNPFKETGGSQSFAVALTDKEKNGVVISSLYARERMSVFAKPITAGSSTYTLTEEEQKAINQSHK